MMGFALKALIWAATNQGNLSLIVQGVSSLLAAYVSLRDSLLASGALNAAHAQVHDAELFATLGREATSARERADALLKELEGP